ncbi:MAG: diguanylate cyclase [Chloroflexi bacterium]|nr:diguanylate cyclase [Chloroflexota bacterium]
MSTEPPWFKEFPGAITICDTEGVIIDMNDTAAEVFKDDDGLGLLGTNVLACHPEPALGKLEGMLDKQTTNAYFNTKKSEKRFFFQSPWYKEDRYAGFVEISFEVPENIPHFIRE